MLTLADPLEHAFRLHRDRVAVIDGDTKLSYGQLHQRSHRLGTALRALGLAAGDRVAILAANGHRYFEAFFGVPAHGLVLVPLNTRLALPELRTILERSGARVLLCDRDPGELSSCVERVVRMPDDYESMLASTTPTAPPAVHEDALAALFYTGGTTGAPKGVMLTHRNLIANAFHKSLACSLTGDDVFLAAPAMFHVAGIAPIVGLVWLGAHSVTLPTFDPGACLDLIQRYRVTVFMPVPTMLGALVVAQRAHARDVSSLRLLGHAGSPITNQLIEDAHATFPATEIAQFYGATETSSIVTCFRNEQRAIGTELLGSCGRAVAGVEVRIKDEIGEECAPGDVGEIWVRGPNVTSGYFDDDAATHAALVDGYYRTGDLGRMRADGYVFVVDRKKDMIVTGGENVYSVEVEDVLGRHPAVLEAAVLGVKDEKWGEAVHAIVVVAPASASSARELPEALREHCRRFIAGYKVPKSIEVRTEALPKSGPGKILKRALRAEYAKDRA